METINPKDIVKLDMKDIAFITLKNNNMIMVDDSAPEKFSEIDNKTKDNIQNNKFLKILISKNINFYFKGRENRNISNLKKTNSNSKVIHNQNILKNDFNIISKISKNISFSFNQNNKKEKGMEIPKNKEEKKVNSTVKGKSRNFLNEINSLFGDKDNQQNTNNTVSLSIIADLNKRYNSTQKEFNSLVQQLKLKKNKYSSSIKDKALYQKYYEIYKNKERNKIIKNINFNRIKHYEESAKEDYIKEKGKDIFDKNIIKNFKTNTIDYSDNNNTLHFGINDSLRTSTTSFYKQKTRSSSDIKITNYKLNSGRIGYSSTLICPLNIFQSKLNS